MADKEMIAVDDHFFFKGDMPYLTLVLKYHTQPVVSRVDGKKERRKNYRSLLTAESTPVFIRKIRKKEQDYHKGKIDENRLVRSAASLVGHIQHANTTRLRQKLLYGLE